MKIFEEKFGHVPLTSTPEDARHFESIKFVWQRAFKTIKREFTGSGCSIKDVIEYIDGELNE